MEQALTTDWINLNYIEAYKWGDRAGLQFEGQTMFPVPVDESRIYHATRSTQGSDESSIVDCFISFVSSYRYSNKVTFAWDWCRYHQEHHRTGYGRTYKDHFQLVKHLAKNLNQYLSHESMILRLQQIAQEVNSFGNGCLALCYPAYCYARAVGEQPVAFVRYLTGFTHTHGDAMQALTQFCSFIDRPETIADLAIADDQEFLQRYGKHHATAYNTLMTAAKCAVKGGYMEVMREAVRIQGDTDSVLSTAMLLWCLLNNGQGIPEGNRYEYQPLPDDVLNEMLMRRIQEEC